MSKVKLTREKAEAVEALKSSSLGNDGAILEFVRACGISNHVFHLDELIKALYIGYEVEPEFKVGDWLVHWAGEENVIRQAVSNVKDDFIDVEDEEGDTYIWNVKHIRQATLEEIAEEKQRRWWAKHGREVWELREGDVLSLYGELLIVSRLEEDRIYFHDTEFEHRTELFTDYRVACFASDRKDVQA